MGRLLHGGQRRAQAAREDERLDPVRPAQLALVRGVGERDHLEAEPAARPQRPVDGLEVRRVVLGAHGLQHLDRHDRVVLAVDVAVVAELDVHQVLQAGLPDPLPGERVLLRRDGDRRHPAAQLPGRVQREAAPARPDLQDVHPGGQARALGEQAVLVPLGIGERLVRRREHGAGVGHRLVQEQAVEVVAQVVVGRDVVAGLVLRVAPGPVQEQARDLERPPPPLPGEGQRRAVERRELDQRQEVRGRPQPVHVRLAHADLPVEDHAQGHRLVVDAELRAALGGRVAEHAPAPVGQDHRQAAHGDPGGRGERGADRERGQRAIREPGDRAGKDAGAHLAATCLLATCLAAAAAATDSP